MSITLFSHGGTQEVTGSKHFLRIDQTTLLIDCGAFQGRRDESDRKNREWPFAANEIQHALLTHAHYDHCGLLPLLCKKGYAGTIYSTPATRDLASIVLLDSARIQAKDIAFMLKKSAATGTVFNRTPLYSEEDVRASLRQFVTYAYHRPMNLTAGLQATFFDAGHILGSAMAFVEARDNGKTVRIGFSGDLGRKGLPIIRDPEPLPACDYLVLESTYGNRLHDSTDETMRKLAEVITRTVERGGKIIIPAFAIERTQELVFFIHLLHDQKKIPRVPIYVDSPMAVNATTVFKLHEECFDDETRAAFIDHAENPFGFNDLTYVTSKEQSQSLNNIKDPAIIISSSGMCESGRILHHLMHTIGDRRNTILIVGYMAEHTLGRRIFEKRERVPIFGEYHTLNAEVEVLNSFSGHADYREICDYLALCDTGRLKKIFLVHGESKAQLSLQKVLIERGFAVEIVAPGISYTLT
jgi:metallo-beta-lactamase family protein